MIGFVPLKSVRPTIQMGRTWRQWIGLIGQDADRRLLLQLLLLCLALVLWAAWSPVDQIVRAEGRIIASARAQIVQHLEGGIVSQILVREGQTVQAGDVLMRMSDVQASTSVQQGQSRLHVLKAQLARLTAEASGQSAPVFEGDIPTDIQQDALNAFRERIHRFQSERQVLVQQYAQRQAELRKRTAAFRTCRKSLSSLESSRR